jgi:hypothetical protein
MQTHLGFRNETEDTEKAKLLNSIYEISIKLFEKLLTFPSQLDSKFVEAIKTTFATKSCSSLFRKMNFKRSTNRHTPLAWSESQCWQLTGRAKRCILTGETCNVATHTCHRNTYTPFGIYKKFMNKLLNKLSLLILQFPVV